MVSPSQRKSVKSRKSRKPVKGVSTKGIRRSRRQMGQLPEVPPVDSTISDLSEATVHYHEVKPVYSAEGTFTGLTSSPASYTLLLPRDISAKVNKCPGHVEAVEVACEYLRRKSPEANPRKYISTCHKVFRKIRFQ